MQSSGKKGRSAKKTESIPFCCRIGWRRSHAVHREKGLSELACPPQGQADCESCQRCPPLRQIHSVRNLRTASTGTRCRRGEDCQHQLRGY